LRNALGGSENPEMTGLQVLRIVVFLIMPLASGVAAMLGQRRTVAVSGWKGDALRYGPVIGASFALAVMVIVVAASVVAGH
jgi:hypothetical protein